MYPFVNNSFEDTLNVFVSYISLDYDVIETIYHNTKIPDSTTVGYNFSKMKKPDCLDVTVNFLTNNCWTNKGGIEYCTLKLKSKVKSLISIRWETISNHTDIEYAELNNNFFRKLKLEKLNKIYECKNNNL